MQPALHLLGRLKVHQKAPHQRLCDLVASNSGHGIAHHAAVPADGNIRGARADIHQRQVQKPQLRRNGGIHGGNGFQCQAGHLKPGRPHGGIEALHHLAGQKSRHYLCLRPPAVVAQQRRQGIVVQPVLGHRIAHHKKLPPALFFHLQSLFRGRQGAGLQPADLLGCNSLFLRQVHGKASALSP